MENIINKWQFKYSVNIIMDKKQQTVVEWLEEQFEESYSYINEIFDETISRAKQKEKQQIIDAHKSGFTEGTCFGATTIYKFQSSKEYYNETFKKK